MPKNYVLWSNWSVQGISEHLFHAVLALLCPSDWAGGLLVLLISNKISYFLSKFLKKRKKKD